MSSTLAVTAAIIVILLVLSGFFSGSETALTAASRAQLRGRAEKGDKYAQKALDLTEDREKLIGAILLGNNFVNILATSLASVVLTSIFSESGVLWATIIMTAAILIFAEVLPKTFAIAHSENVARWVAPTMVWVVILLSPIVALVRLIVRMILRLFGDNEAADLQEMAHQEIMGTIQLHHSEGGVEKQDRDRLLGALDLKNRNVEEIMKHRSDIEMVNLAEGPEAIMEQILASAHTRLPIYQDEPENIVGVIHAKDLLREVNRIVSESADQNMLEIAKLDVLKVAMPPYFVPETTSLDDQMHAFLARKSHFALVVDEYGTLQGLITLEDILEEIVGGISDEYDEEDSFEYLEDGSVVLDGSMTIRDANRVFEWRLPDEEANTLAGLIMHEAQIIPKKGQKFSFYDYRFEVLERERNRITRLAVKAGN